MPSPPRRFPRLEVSDQGRRYLSAPRDSGRASSRQQRAGGRPTFQAGQRPAPDRKPDPILPEIGAPLALTRRALALTRFKMARLLGTDTSTWGTYEAGLQGIPADQALKLSAYGIPLDW